MRQTPKLPYEKYQKTGLFDRQLGGTGRAGRWESRRMAELRQIFLARGLDFRSRKVILTGAAGAAEIERMIWTGYLDYLYH